MSDKTDERIALDIIAALLGFDEGATPEEIVRAAVEYKQEHSACRDEGGYCKTCNDSDVVLAEPWGQGLVPCIACPPSPWEEKPQTTEEVVAEMDRRVAEMREKGELP